MKMRPMEEERVEGNTITIILRKDNILEIVDNEDWNQADSLEVVKKDTLLIQKTINGQTNKALLIHVPNRHTSQEILNHYQQTETGAVARGLLISSFATKVMGNLYLKLFGGKPNEAGRVVPIKLFTKKEEAIKWLLEQINRLKK